MLTMLFMLLVCAAAPARGQTPPPPKPAPQLARWIDVQNATINVRYRFADDSAGTITTNQVQHRQGLRARFKFDAPGRYALNVGAFSGSRFTSSWNNTGIGLGDWRAPLAVRALYLAAQPVTGIQAQYGSLFIIKGESTEITTYDEDGYVIGQRVSVRRPQTLFFEEVSATVGYLTGDPAEYGVSKRVKYLNDRPNYFHYLVDKKIGTRAGISVDYTSVGGARTWRAATLVNTREVRVVDSIRFENYKRTNRSSAYGFAVSANKALTRKLGVGLGYASIDPRYGGLNSDRFNIGNRVFALASYALSSRFTASAFITRAIGNDVPLPHRTLSNLILAYNALPDLRRTGLF